MIKSLTGYELSSGERNIGHEAFTSAPECFKSCMNTSIIYKNYLIISKFTQSDTMYKKTKCEMALSIYIQYRKTNHVFPSLQELRNKGNELRFGEIQQEDLSTPTEHFKKMH